MVELRGHLRYAAASVVVPLAAAAILAAPALATPAAAASAGPAVTTAALLSQGKPATASSTGGSAYVASNAFDGKTSTRWASVSHVDPQWLRVDLGATASITSVKLIWDLSCATAYQIQVSADGKSFTTAYSTTNGKGGTETISVKASGRYVRMYGTKRCRDRGYSLQEMQVFGTTGSSGGGGSNPFGDSHLVSMFDGKTLNGWTSSASGGWIVKNGAIHGTGNAGRGWIYYNKEQVGSFRWIFDVRQIDGDHAPTVLIWGTLNPIRDALSAIQFQPPNGGHWDYRPGKNTSGGSEFTSFSHPKWDVHNWNQCEILGNESTGVARMACCPLASGASTCKATEVLDFHDKTAGRVGPLAIQVHNGGISDEYKNLWVESPVSDASKLITT